jgi:hypothetical protein
MLAPGQYLMTPAPPPEAPRPELPVIRPQTEPRPAAPAAEKEPEPRSFLLTLLRALGAVHT